MSELTPQDMTFPNVWTTKRGNLALLICPKAGCSTLAQFLYYSQAGAFWGAEIHDETTGLLGYAGGSRGQLAGGVVGTRRTLGAWGWGLPGV